MVFDPKSGRPIVAPPCAGPGCWAGAPGSYRDDKDLYVAYRMRRPEPSRGYEVRIAGSRDGQRFETVWSAGKEQFDAESIERCALTRAGDVWRLYPSFVRRSDRRWCIGIIEARSVDAFDATATTVVLDPVDHGLAAVKDPWLRRHRGRWLMSVSCGMRPESQHPGLHATGDALSTGLTLSVSGIATSVDGWHWTWEGPTLWPSPSGWDKFTARLSTAVRDGDGWIGLYDGSASIADNYEERCGLARSRDLRQWERISTAGPAIGTARGPGGVRYVEINEAGDVLYEYTRMDGAHELRIAHTA